MIQEKKNIGLEESSSGMMRSKYILQSYFRGGIESLLGVDVAGERERS